MGKNRKKTILSWTLRIIVGIVLLFILLWGLLQFTAVQNWVTKRVTNTLEKRLQTHVQIDHVKLKFFSDATLHGIYLEDQEGDTLLYAGEMDIDISLFQLFKKRVHFKSISLFDASIDLHSTGTDSLMNYAFLFDLFGAKDAGNKPSEAGTQWDVDLKNLVLNNIHFIYTDTFQHAEIESYLGTSHINFDNFDLVNKKISLTDFFLAHSSVLIHTDTPLNSTENALVFPTLGWDLAAQQAYLNDIGFAYHNHAFPQMANQLDVQHLEIQDASIYLEDFNWNDSLISGFVDEAFIKDHQGFEISKFSTKFRMTHQLLSTEDLVIKTPKSEIIANGSLSYQKFQHLSAFEDSVDLILDIEQSMIHFEDLNYLYPDWKKWGIETKRNQTISLNGNLEGKISALNTSGITFNIGNQFSTQFSGKIFGLPDTDRMVVSANFQKLNTSYDHLRSLIPGIPIPEGIKNWGNIQFSGNVSGTMRSIVGKNVVIKTEGATTFEGDLIATNLQDPARLEYELNIQKLATKSEDLSGFMTKNLPEPFDRLGVFSYEGILKGNAYDYDIDGLLISEAGTAEADLEINFSDDYQNATYSGEIKMDTFDLGLVFENPELGRVSLDLTANGKGLNEKDIAANLKGNIRAFRFKDYLYKDLFVDGRLIQKKFIGRAQLDDPNLSFLFDGQADLNGDIPDFIFTMQLDTFVPNVLNLFDQPYQFKGNVFANFIGDGIDRVNGEVIAENLTITTDHGSYQTPMASLSSTSINNERRIEFHSELGQAYLAGQFKILEVEKAFWGYLNHHFQVDQKQLRGSYQEQVFDFGCTLSNPVPLISLFDPKLTNLDTAAIAGNMNTRNRELKIEGAIPHLVYDEMIFDTIEFNSLGDASEILTALTTKEIQLPTSSIPSSDIKININNDSILFDASILDQADQNAEKFALSGVAQAFDSMYVIHLDTALNFNGDLWKIDNANRISIQEKEIDISGLNLYKPGQEILIKTIEKRKQDLEPPIEIGLRQFKLAQISTLLGRKEEDFYDGKANGNILIQNPFNDFSFLADLNIEEFSLYDQVIGTGFMSARQRASTQVDIEIDLYGENNNASVLGTYNIYDATLDLTADVQSLELRIADPFLENLIYDSEGSLRGSVDIIGDAFSPEINGRLQFVDASTIVDFLQTRYSILENNLTFKGKSIDFGRITFLDPSGNDATLSGQIDYKNLLNANLDLKFVTDRFQIINTTSNDNELFYGKIFIQGDATIKGNTDRPSIVSNARTLDSTNFFIQPLSYEDQILNEDFIIFANPETYAGDSTIDMNELYQLSDIGVDLAANITITPEAQLQIVVDPATGDQLVCRGNADLVLNMNAEGDLSVVGNYTLTSGQYTFVFQKVIRKEFEIDPGSTVSFIGDPMDARFNVNAKYKISTPTYPLIAKESSVINDFELRQAKEKSEVEIQLAFTGDLEEPKTELDIVIASNQGASQIGGTVSTKLAQLRENESDLNLQIFSLLLFDAFVSLESSNDNFVETAGVNVGLSTVSNLLTNQLNQLAKKFIKGVDLDFGVDSYRSGYDNTTITELQVGLRKKLLNDRLSIYVGGSLNNEAQEFLDPTQNSNATYSGDFVVEWKLTKDGDYQLRFSQVVSNEQTVFNQGANYYEAGIAIFFRKSFNSKRYQLRMENEGDEKQ